jgi:hypothetical protein
VIVVRDGSDVTQNVLEKAVTAELVGSFGLFGRLELGFGLPFHVVYDGDLRLVPKLALV